MLDWYKVYVLGRFFCISIVQKEQISFFAPQHFRASKNQRERERAETQHNTDTLLKRIYRNSSLHFPYCSCWCFIRAAKKENIMLPNKKICIETFTLISILCISRLKTIEMKFEKLWNEEIRISDHSNKIQSIRFCHLALHIEYFVTLRAPNSHCFRVLHRLFFFFRAVLFLLTHSYSFVRMLFFCFFSLVIFPSFRNYFDSVWMIHHV